MSPDKAVSNGVEHVVGAATKLRRFLEQSNKILPCPGVYDGFSARIALQVGFDALYMASSLLPPSSHANCCRLEQVQRHHDSVRQILESQPNPTCELRQK